MCWIVCELLLAVTAVPAEVCSNTECSGGFDLKRVIWPMKSSLLTSHKLYLLGMVFLPLPVFFRLLVWYLSYLCLTTRFLPVCTCAAAGQLTKKLQAKVTAIAASSSERSVWWWWLLLMLHTHCDSRFLSCLHFHVSSLLFDNKVH